MFTLQSLVRMRYITLFFLLFFITGKNTLAQSLSTSATVLPSKSTFDEFQKIQHFLNFKNEEIISYSKQLNTLFSANKIKIKDSIEIKHFCDKLYKTMEEFTDFNARQLIDIDKQLTGNIPIRGSEMTYLNKSFQVYNSLMLLDKRLQKKLKKFPKVRYEKATRNLRINQLNAFYRNYYKVISNKRMRRVLNASDATYLIKDDDFKKMALANLNASNYKGIRKKIYKNREESPTCIKADSSIYLQIKQNSYKKSRIRQDRKKIKRFFRQDHMYRIGQFFTHNLSGIVGNFAGLFRFRKGYLYRNSNTYNEILSQLKPMDLIAEKTGFTLTDKMIPGYFGHIAIWLGTEAQLKEMQLWNHVTIKPLQDKIRKGYSILETDRKGTHLKTLHDYLNVDAVAIASIKGFQELSKEDKIMLYQNALAQIGKQYDFNFDVETSDKLVCSELLYQVFGTIHWPTDSFMKRQTISPDNVLSLSLYQNSPIELAYYVRAKSRKRTSLKSLDDLAKDLGFQKKNDLYVIPDKKCEKVAVEGKKRLQKQCRIIYHELIYK